MHIGTDIPSCTAYVRFREQSGHAVLHCICLLFTYCRPHSMADFDPKQTVVDLGILGSRLQCLIREGDAMGEPKDLLGTWTMLSWKKEAVATGETIDAHGP